MTQAATDSEVKKMQETAEKGSEHKIHPHLDEKSSNEALSELGKLKSQATKLLSFIGITVSLTKMNQIVESFSEVNDKIKYASDGLEDQQAIQDKILQSANECRTSYEEFGTYVADLSSQSKDLFPIDDAREFAKLLSQNETVAGKASNLSNVQTMLKSVFSTGKVSSTVFAQLKKTAPEVVDVLSEGLGKTEKQLESMAAGGTLGNTVSAGKTTNTNNNSVEQHVQNTFYCTDKDMATKAGGAIKTSSKNAADELANQMAHTGR